MSINYFRTRMVRSTNNLVFSSIFPCNNKRVNERFIDACKKLGLEEWRLKPTVKEAYTSLLESPRVTKGRGPEGSKVVDVRGDGNCLFYSLMAPLLGFVPGPADKVVLEYFGTLDLLYKIVLPTACFSIDSSPATVWLYEGIRGSLQDLDGCLGSICVGAVKGWASRDVFDV